MSQLESFQQRVKVYTEERIILDALEDEAFDGSDQDRLAIYRDRVKELNVSDPNAALVYQYDQSLSSVRSTERYLAPPHRPTPRIRFLPKLVKDFIETENGRAAIGEAVAIFRPAINLIGQYEQTRIREGIIPKDWEDFGKVVTAQQTVIIGVGQRACVRAGIELPHEFPMQYGRR